MAAQQRDIVDVLRDAAAAIRGHGGFVANELTNSLDQAAIEIVRLRHTLWELSACVQAAEKRKECVKHARRLAPLPTPDQFMLHQFHKTDLLWSQTAAGKEVPW